MINKVKKLIYLLQLEEYNNKRFLLWLKKYNINNLNEVKKNLVLTFRARIILCVTLFFSPIIKPDRTITFTNKVFDMFVHGITFILIHTAKIKLYFYPNLTKIIITGSYGKTTFKEMLSFALKDDINLLQTPENKNTAIAISHLVIKSLKNEHKLLIIEAGAYKKGEIKEICDFIKPDIGVITVFGYMHLERFGTFENIKKAKLELFHSITDKKRVFLPRKDHEFIDFENTIIKIAKIFNLNITKIRSKISKFENPIHRQSISTSGGVTIIDDTYNSNPLGFKKALETLFKNYKNHQKIIVTPGIIELGTEQEKQNRILAIEALDVVDYLIVIGETNKKSYVNISNQDKIHYLGKNENQKSLLQKIIRPPSVILLENDLPDHYF